LVCTEHSFSPEVLVRPIRHRLPALLATAGLLAAGAAPALAQGGTATAASAYTVSTLHFKVTVGPSTARQTCDVVGDLYKPASAATRTPAAAVLTTNGFGGSKDDQAPLGRLMAADGYVVLSYSGLGFGGSTCKITLDDPTYDGQAASQLVSYLGGAPGIAYTDAQHTVAAPRLTVVRHDVRDHAGVKRTYDPRVGMVGGSYGGEIQFAAAGDDARVDTIVPLITWNDLDYSLGPNNTDQVRGVSTGTPGAVKIAWGAGFSALGMVDGLQQAGGDPSRLYPCPNFADFVCPALVTAGSTGFFQPDARAAFRHASVASYLTRIRIPVLLMQGENDTLFNLNEAVANYQALRAQGTPVKMVWQSWGHSGPSAPGDIDLANPNPATQYETGRIKNWFDHYLQGSTVSTGPQFAYFRDWVTYTGNAAPAYGTSTAFPVGSSRTWQLSGTDALVPAGSSGQSGSQSFTTPAAGAPTSLEPVDVLGGYTAIPLTANPTDAPGTAASWTTAPLASPVDVVGSPVVKVQLQAPTAAATQAAGPAGQLVLFVRVADVAPDGTATLIHGLEAPIRVPDVSRPVTVRVPAIVHRFAAGHAIRLTFAGGSPNYRGGVSATPVTIASGAGQTLTLPVLG
jgi:predicted acyl esterase